MSDTPNNSFVRAYISDLRNEYELYMKNSGWEYGSDKPAG